MPQSMTCVGASLAKRRHTQRSSCSENNNSIFCVSVTNLWRGGLETMLDAALRRDAPAAAPPSAQLFDGRARRCVFGGFGGFVICWQQSDAQFHILAELQIVITT